MIVAPGRTASASVESSLSTGVGAGGASAKVSDNGAMRDWVHHALIRDEKGGVKFYENGEELKLDARLTRSLGKVTFDRLNLGQGRGEYRAVVDDVCQFDRALTADEVKSLAGRKELPKEKGKQ